MRTVSDGLELTLPLLCFVFVTSKDPEIRKKIEKLIAAGVLGVK
jgi:hypothetical protein